MALNDYLVEAERCAQCSYCEFIPFDHVKSWRFSLGCPSTAYTKFGTYSARGKYNVIWSLLDGRSTYSDTVLDIAYKCLTCGSCDVACKICRYNLHPLEMIREFRAKLVADGKTLPQHMAVINNLRKEDNTMMKPRVGRGNWAEGLNVKRVPGEKPEVLFHAGCRYSYDEGLWNAARAAITVINNAGVDIGIMGEHESCCGARAYDMGYHDDFEKLADSRIRAWSNAGVKTIVTSCAECYHAVKRLYPALGLKIEVLHTVELISRLISEGKINFTNQINMNITYHDPCKLGRQGEPYVPWDGKEKKVRNQIIVYEPKRPRYNGAWGVYDAPRDILKNIPGLKLLEMERTRESAWCCGAGGGVREAYPDFSNWTATERIEEVKSTGAEAVVSACPWCERNLIDAIEAMSGKMKVFDIAELAQKAI